MSTLPLRIQLKRTKGWRKPDNTIVVARPSKWGNLWRVGLVACNCRRSASECVCNTFNRATAAEAVAEYRDYIMPLNLSMPSVREAIAFELKGKNLACWCPLDSPCHADVLLELANR